MALPAIKPDEEIKDDFIGRKINEWEILSFSHRIKHKDYYSYYYLCRCSCGRLQKIEKYSIINGRSTQCNKKSAHADKEDLVGKKFHKLTVMEYDHYDGEHYWRCKCDCGGEKIASSKRLKQGSNKTCGCGRLVKGSGRRDFLKREYVIYFGILARCYNPDHPAYKNYGGRGINVDERWLGKDGVNNFIADMGNSKTRTQIDRIDNDGPYSPKNCRWVTAKTNCRNTRANKILTYKNKTQCLTAWAEEYGLSLATLRRRLSVWSTEKALTEPLQKRSLKHESN